MRSITLYNIVIMTTCSIVSVFGLVLLYLVDMAYPELRTNVSVWEAPEATLLLMAALGFILAGPFLMTQLIDDGRYPDKPGSY